MSERGGRHRPPRPSHPPDKAGRQCVEEAREVCANPHFVDLQAYCRMKPTPMWWMKCPECLHCCTEWHRGACQYLSLSSETAQVRINECKCAMRSVLCCLTAVLSVCSYACIMFLVVNMVDFKGVSALMIGNLNPR